MSDHSRAKSDPEGTALVRSAMPMCATMAIEVVAIDPDNVVLRLPDDGRWHTAGAVVHGGALMTLADSAGAALAHLNLPDGAARTATVASATSFLAPARGPVTASAIAIGRGRSVFTVRTDLHDGDGTLVAQTTQTQQVVGR